MNYFRLLSILAGIIFLTLPGLTNYANAQTKFGITGGLNITSHLNSFKFTSGDIQLDLKPKITSGYQAGFILRQNISKAFRIQIEPSVILLGARYEESFMLRDFEFQTKSETELLYLQVPLLFQLSTVPPQRVVYGRKAAKTTYHLSGGIFGGYLLNARFFGTNTGTPIGIEFEGDFSNDVTSQYSEYDGGVMLGMGLEYGYYKKIGLEVRALYSVLDSGDSPEISFEPHNIAVTFAAYFIF